jgi:hypothetical protein
VVVAQQDKAGRFSSALEKIFKTQDGEVLLELCQMTQDQWVYHFSGLQTLQDIAFREGQREFARRLMELGGKVPVRDVSYNDTVTAIPSRVEQGSVLRDVDYRNTIIQMSKEHIDE